MRLNGSVIAKPSFTTAIAKTATLYEGEKLLQPLGWMKLLVDDKSLLMSWVSNLEKMAWVSNLEPDLVLEAPILGLTRDILQHYTLKGLVLDVDETLVPLKASQASEELRAWVEEIRPVASLWLVSNNLSETRIGGIANSLNLPYLHGAGKPSRRKLKKAADAMNLPVEQVAMVGDRLFTDVLAGNRLGMFTILVEPMIDPTQSAYSSPIRDFEVWISQILGVSLSSKQHKFTKNDKSRQTEI